MQPSGVRFESMYDRLESVRPLVPSVTQPRSDQPVGRVARRSTMGLAAGTADRKGAAKRRRVSEMDSGARPARARAGEGKTRTTGEAARVAVVAGPERALGRLLGRRLDLAAGADDADDLGQVRELRQGGVGVVAERARVKRGSGRRRGGRDEDGGEEGGVGGHR